MEDFDRGRAHNFASSKTDITNYSCDLRDRSLLAELVCDPKQVTVHDFYQRAGYPAPLYFSTHVDINLLGQGDKTMDLNILALPLFADPKKSLEDLCGIMVHAERSRALGVMYIPLAEIKQEYKQLILATLVASPEFTKFVQANSDRVALADAIRTAAEANAVKS